MFDVVTGRSHTVWPHSPTYCTVQHASHGQAHCFLASILQAYLLLARDPVACLLDILFWFWTLWRVLPYMGMVGRFSSDDRPPFFEICNLIGSLYYAPSWPDWPPLSAEKLVCHFVSDLRSFWSLIFTKPYIRLRLPGYQTFGGVPPLPPPPPPPPPSTWIRHILIGLRGLEAKPLISIVGLKCYAK